MRVSLEEHVIPIGLMAPPPGQGQANPWMQFLPLVLIFGIFYFLLIRPARKRQKAVQQMLEDREGLNDWVADLEVDIACSRDTGEPVLRLLRLGALE